MKRILKFLCILSILLIPISAFGQGSIHRRNGKGGFPKPAATANNQINGHEFVDLGLPSGLKWATCNVGAKSSSEYGNYFAWGETYIKKDYTSSNSRTYGRTFGDIGGNADFDAARANWGGTWRLPTKEEFEELLKKCTWTFVSMSGHKGYKVTGPNGNYIFLPAAGDFHGSSIYSAGSLGNYWSSTPSGSKRSYELSFNSGGRSVNLSSRDYGQSVRPVSK